jgi:hypothetical protein
MLARVLIPLAVAVAAWVVVGAPHDVRSWAAYLAAVGVVTIAGCVIRFWPELRRRA